MSDARANGLIWGPATKLNETPALDTPYQHWWHEKERPDRFTRREYGAVFLPTILRSSAGRVAPRAKVFMPPEMVNPAEPPATWSVEQMGDTLNCIAVPDDKMVIVGIVDVGIALGHRRFRTCAGTTRFLAAWQQSATFGGQSFLPFGREVYAHDINRDLETYSNGDLSGTLDEEGFNREVGLVTPELERGNRALDYRAAHGTHVLDLATGFDPAFVSKCALNTIPAPRIIAVNLPPRTIHGTAGNFLAFFARSAVERIVFLADALWAVHHKDKPGGFRLVINFSFGQLAGPKDGSARFEQEIRDLVQARNDRGAPTRVVMPAGNNNLSRGNARMFLRGQKSKFIVPWRIVPSDHTSNFVEIWTKAHKSERQQSPDEISPGDVQLWITPPGSTRLPVPSLGHGEYSDLSDYARVYCYRPYNQKRAHFVVCVAPTFSNDPATPEAPAGLWEIALLYPRPDADPAGAAARAAIFGVETTFTVQSDQSGLPHAVTGRQSYFDDDRYETHGEDGRTTDSYAPGPDRARSGPHNEPWPSKGPVQRKGTQNALATWKGVLVIGGYRISDGTPALFSSTFDGNSRRKGGREAPSVLYPTDDGAAHFGLLAAGSRDGSVVALRGTSMATALATRDIAAALARDGKADERWLRHCADQYRSRNSDLKRYNPLKQGAGPVRPPDTGRVGRRCGGMCHDEKKCPSTEKD